MVKGSKQLGHHKEATPTTEVCCAYFRPINADLSWPRIHPGME